jgi:ribosomal protein S27E
MSQPNYKGEETVEIPILNVSHHSTRSDFWFRVECRECEWYNMVYGAHFTMLYTRPS